jgi:hypothetical protein
MSVKKSTPKAMPAAPSGASIFHEFSGKILPRLVLPLMSRSLLETYRNPDATADRVAVHIDRNPYYGELLLRRVDALSGGKLEGRGAPSGALVQLGMQGSRNLLLALQAVRTASQAPVGWGKDGKKPEFEISDVLRYALNTEAWLEKDPAENSEIGFAAGLLHDVTDLVARETIREPALLKETRSYIDTMYKKGFLAAKVATMASRLLPDFALRKYVFSAALMHGVGKSLLAITDPAYLAFQVQADEKSLAAPIRIYLEKKRFGVSYPQISWLACAAMGVFQEVERALLFHCEPFLLRQDSKAEYELAQLVRLGANMAEHPDKIDHEDDAKLLLWKGPELAGLKLTSKQLMEIAKKLF